MHGEKSYVFLRGNMWELKNMARWGWNVSINSPLGTVENVES